jgi:flagellar motor protein MotB
VKAFRHGQRQLTRHQTTEGPAEQMAFFRQYGRHLLCQPGQGVVCPCLQGAVAKAGQVHQMQPIVGSHTDPIGGKRYNEWLSRMRSEAVFQILLDRDIPEKVIHIKDWGLENPVYANDNFMGRIKNRRVDVILRPVVF